MGTTILNKISTYFANPIKKKDETPKTFSPALKQLEKDTVSFSGNKSKTLNYFASELNTIGKRVSGDFEAMCKRIFGEHFETSRVKATCSIENKLGRKILPDEKLTTQKAITLIKDLLASRGVTDGSKESINVFVNRLCEEIKKGSCKITEIRNYRGVINEAEEKIITPYFSKEHLQKIKEAHPLIKPKTKESKGKISSGYTATHILGTIKGVPFEFQIKGNCVKTVDDGTHLLHSIDLGKSYIKGKKIPEEIKEIAELYENLSPKKREIHDKYITNCYNRARIAELKGTKLILAPAPKEIPFELTIPHLIARAKEFGYT